jgi:phytoene synthase
MTTSARHAPLLDVQLPEPPAPREWDAYLSRHGRSFWKASLMIPHPYRTRVAGVYAYCRYTDDLVDATTESPAATLRRLDLWEHLSRVAYCGQRTGYELLDVVMSDMARSGVGFTYVQSLIRGMRTDIAGPRFATLDDLVDYCHDVASVVGL